MKNKLNIKKYWILVAVVIIVNLLVFSFFSRHLESFVVDYTANIKTSNGL